MLYLTIKAVLSGIIIVAAAKVAERSPLYGAFIVSLPLVSVLTLVWLWRDTADSEKVAALSEGGFWLALPTLPMFLALPEMLGTGLHFGTHSHSPLRSRQFFMLWRSGFYLSSE